MANSKYAAAKAEVVALEKRLDEVINEFGATLINQVGSSLPALRNMAEELLNFREAPQQDREAEESIRKNTRRAVLEECLTAIEAFSVHNTIQKIKNLISDIDKDA